MNYGVSDGSAKKRHSAEFRIQNAATAIAVSWG